MEEVYPGRRGLGRQKLLNDTLPTYTPHTLLRPHPVGTPKISPQKFIDTPPMRTTQIILWQKLFKIWIPKNNMLPLMA